MLKEFNVRYQYSVIGTATIEVPANLTHEEALQYAKEHMDEVPLPADVTYLQDSEVIDEEGCGFVA